MKLNYDCVRDVLLTLEDTLDIKELTYNLGEGEESHFNFSTTDIEIIAKHERLKSYPKTDIFYSIHKLYEADYIVAGQVNAENLTRYLIQDITYNGHEFLQSIKSDTVWNDVKKVSSKVGTMSFPIISSIASNVIAKLISTSLGVG
jgi:hypothetical protein